MLKGNVSKAFLLACLMVGLVSGVAFAGVTLSPSDSYTMGILIRWNTIMNRAQAAGMGG